MRPTPPPSSADLPSTPAHARRPLLRRPWVWIVAAFLVGLLLAMWALMRDRESGEFFRAGTGERADSAPEYAPLPAPLPAGEAETVGMPSAPAEIDEEARNAEREAARRAAATPPVRREPPPRMARTRPEPLPGQTPSPRYPASALRRGEGGTVIVRVDIGPDGVPTSTSLERGSGSRDLDRAAVDAVRRWRFSPAMVDGRPTVDSVLVPIEFTRD